MPSMRMFEAEIQDVPLKIIPLHQCHSDVLHIFFHGYNTLNSEEELAAFCQYVQGIDDANKVLVRWDSGDTLGFMAYKKSECDANKLALGFVQLLRDIVQDRHFSEINLIGHSLGGRIIVNALMSVHTKLPYSLSKIVLLAAAVPWHAQAMASFLSQHRCNFFNFYSPLDVALTVKPDQEECIGKYGIAEEHEAVFNILCPTFGHSSYWMHLTSLLEYIGFSSEENFQKFKTTVRGGVAMFNEKISVENRIKNLKDFYVGLDSLLSTLDDTIPSAMVKTIKEGMLNDTELKSFIHGIEEKRPPKVLLVGRTGVGKSSLINALFGEYVASVSNVKSCTTGASVYACTDAHGHVRMEILDTRGISESESLSAQSAEDQLRQDIAQFVPDVVLFVLPANARDNIHIDIAFLQRVQQEYVAQNKVELPVIALINKVDDVPPSRFKTAAEYSPSKLENIAKITENYKQLFAQQNFYVRGVVPVSSLIDWQNAHGHEVCVETIASLPPEAAQELTIAFDGRYNMDAVLALMEESMQDAAARKGLMLALRLDDFIRALSQKVVNTFSGIAGTVAVTPIPFSDLFVLLPVQSAMVACIAMLSGRKADMNTAKEFIASLGGVVGAGMAFRLIAQQASKLLNGLYPVSGSLISSTIAASGTKALGGVAMAYYLDNSDLSEVKKQFVNTG